MKDNSVENDTPLASSNKRIHLFLILASCGLILLISILFIFLWKGNTDIHKAQQQALNPSPSNSQTEKNNRTIYSAPKVIFERYSLKTPFPVNVTSHKSYSLKSNFTQNEITALGNKIGLDTIKKTEHDSYILSNTSSPDTRGILEFYSKTGAFAYSSYGIVNKSSTPASLSNHAKSFLSTIGVNDPTVKCAITYKRHDAPREVTFVECHRDWSLLGSPLVNLPGILNLNIDTKLSSLIPGVTLSVLIPDASIYQVSTGAEGNARPSDFNTATIGMYDDGRIYSVVSNLRWVSEEKVLSSSSLKTPTEALADFSSHKATVSLTLPSGNGLPDWNRLYPENIAKGESADITEMSLVYLEKSQTSAQDRYEPYYLIRGESELVSGYTVKYAQALPALKDEQSTTNNFVALNQAEEKGNQLQLNSFKPEKKTGSSDSTPPPPLKLPTTCNTDSLQGKDVSLQVPEFGELVVVIPRAYLHAFFLKSANGIATDTKSIKDAIYKAVENQYVVNVALFLKGNATLNSEIKTTEDIKRIYDFINLGKTNVNIAEVHAHTTPSVFYCDLAQAPSRPAPIISCINFAGSQGQLMESFDFAKQSQIANNVANRILDAIKQNKLNSLPTTDIFPPETNNSLHSVFYESVLLLGTNGKGSYGSSACYITGDSPAVFLYPEKTTQVTIQTDAVITYSNPSYNSKWDITASSNGLLTTNKASYEYLYYEYDPTHISFTNPDTGFVVSRSDWKSVTSTLSKEFKLTSAESDRLEKEVHNTLTSLQTPYIRISILNEEEVNNKLPIHITPPPHTLRRIHLSVQGLTTPITLKPPTIQPIARSKFTVIELGAHN